MTDNTVGASVRRRLTELDRDQKWLAKLLGVDQSTVSRWLDGSRQMTVADLQRIALVLHRPAGWLLEAPEPESVPA